MHAIRTRRYERSGWKKIAEWHNAWGCCSYECFQGVWCLAGGTRPTQQITIYRDAFRVPAMILLTHGKWRMEKSTTLQHSKNFPLFFYRLFSFNKLLLFMWWHFFGFGLGDVSRCADRVKGCCRFDWQYMRNSKSKKCALCTQWSTSIEATEMPFHLIRSFYLLTLRIKRDSKINWSGIYNRHLR